jgi:hypothetical protein
MIGEAPVFRPPDAGGAGASFSGGDEFRAAVAAAGQPAPRIEPLGDLYAAHAREGGVR